MIRSPAEIYIKSLIARGMENDAIATQLEWEGLDFISQHYVDSLRDRLALPTPFVPSDPLHRKSQRFLHREGLHILFYPDDDMRRAQAVLENPPAKEFVETMLLSRAPAGAIALGTSRYRGIACSPHAIELYRHCYWNVDLLDGAQTRALLELRHEKLAASERPEDRALATAAKRAQDPRKMAADLPFSPMAAMLVQMRLGLAPAQIRLADHLIAARNLAVLRTEECLYSPSPKDAARAVQYAMTARIMHELVEGTHRPDEHLHAELETIALRMDSSPLPTIHALSRGEHTADLQPLARSEDAHARDARDTPGSDSTGRDDPAD